MKLKEFLEEKNVTGFELIPGQLVISVITDGDTLYALDVDTSTIEGGTDLVRETEFVIEDETLTVSGLTLNIETTSLLSFEETMNTQESE
jgi:hypothetical protein